MALRQTAKLYQHRGHALVSGPAVEPVTAQELRDQVRDDVSALPDTEADDLIAEAREFLEEQSGFAFITQDWRLALDRWPTQGQEPWWDGVMQGAIGWLHGPDHAADLELPRYPLQSIQSVTVYDEDSNATTVTVADVFDVDTYSKPGRLRLKRGATWPVALRGTNAIEIVYRAGYGDSAADMPAPLRRAVRTMAAHMYVHRGDCDASGAALESGAMAMLGTFKVKRI